MLPAFRMIKVAVKKSARKKKESFYKKVPEIVMEEKIDMTEEKKPRKKLKNRPFIVGLVIVLIIILGAVGFYAYSYFQQDAVTIGSTPSEKQVKEVIEKVGKLVVLPEGETPTIATVTDVDKLRNQPFFKNAQNGDKLIVIGSTKEAILYRPSINKIITMAPINASETSSPSATTSSEESNNTTPTPTSSKTKVAVLNSTKESGLAKKGSDLLSKDAFEIAGTSNAQGEYELTSISVINKSVVTDAVTSKIISSLGKVKAVTKPLPSGEAAPAGADVVIILGSDFAESY